MKIPGYELLMERLFKGLDGLARRGDVWVVKGLEETLDTLPDGNAYVERVSGLKEQAYEELVGVLASRARENEKEFPVYATMITYYVKEGGVPSPYDMELSGEGITLPASLKKDSFPSRLSGLIPPVDTRSRSLEALVDVWAAGLAEGRPAGEIGREINNRIRDFSRLYVENELKTLPTPQSGLGRDPLRRIEHVWKGEQDIMYALMRAGRFTPENIARVREVTVPLYELGGLIALARAERIAKERVETLENRLERRDGRLPFLSEDAFERAVKLVREAETYFTEAGQLTDEVYKTAVGNVKTLLDASRVMEGIMTAAVHALKAHEELTRMRNTLPPEEERGVLEELRKTPYGSEKEPAGYLLEQLEGIPERLDSAAKVSLQLAKILGYD